MLITIIPRARKNHKIWGGKKTLDDTKDILLILFYFLFFQNAMLMNINVRTDHAYHNKQFAMDIMIVLITMMRKSAVSIANKKKMPTLTI